MPDKTERDIALNELQEAVGRVIGHALNEVKERDDVASVKAAEAINRGVLSCHVVMEWPSTDVHIFLNGLGDEEPKKLMTITTSQTKGSH